MKAPTPIPPPENWQDFETLCKKLWGEIWNCSDTIKKNGRSGQVQNGVDVSGAPNNGVEYYGIQCKGKDNYTNSQLTEKEIDTEIAKAQSFKPQLKRFYFATTAVKDAKIEEYIRLKNVENQTKGGFSIDIYSWEDIVDLLKENRDTYNWYISDCQYVDNSDVEITAEESVVNPVYYRTTKKYVYSQNQSIFSALGLEAGDLSFSLHGGVDYRIRTVTISIINNGSTVLSDYKMYMWFSGVEKVSNGEYFSPFETSEIRAIQNERRELFEVRDCETDLVFEPKNKRLVQNDSKTFTADVTPLEDAKEIIIEWEFLSDGYSKEGKMSIPVENVYEDREKAISVSSLIEEREEIIIEPKIVNS